jgi:hypothetical protein
LSNCLVESSRDPTRSERSPGAKSANPLCMGFAGVPERRGYRQKDGKGSFILVPTPGPEAGLNI